MLVLPRPGQSLDKRLKQHGALSVDRAASAARQIALAIGFLHDHHLARLDLKAANAVWEDSRRCAYLIDFGQAETFPCLAVQFETYATSIARPPELWKAQTQADMADCARPSVDACVSK